MFHDLIGITYPLVWFITSDGVSLRSFCPLGWCSYWEDVSLGLVYPLDAYNPWVFYPLDWHVP